jgi:hypothetical protein
MNLAPFAVQKFFDNNGLPLAGGKLFTYITTTTTKLVTYTDASGGTPNANPIILNARGECDVWMPLVNTYTFTLAPATDTDPPTNPIWSRNGISAATTYADMIAYLPIPVPVADGGTGATTVGAALINLGLIDIAEELTITAGVSLDSSSLGRSIVLADSGTPANYTVNLPAGAPVSSMIQIRVANGATKLYTIAGVDVGIDGSPNRVMWQGESCLLVREAANWTKIGGRTIPFRGVLQRTALLAITTGATWVKAAMQVEVGDPTALALCFDVANGQFVAPRSSSWNFVGYASIAATVGTSAASAEGALSQNTTLTPSSTPTSIFHTDYPVSGSREIVLPSANAMPLTAGQFVELLGRIVAGGGGGTATGATFEYVAATLVPSLSYTEVPIW